MHLLIYYPNDSTVIFISKKGQQSHCVSRRHFFCWLREKQAQTHSAAHRYMHKCSWLRGDRRSLSSTLTQMGSIPHTPDHQWKRNHAAPPQKKKITTLLQPGATSDFMSAAARLIYSRSAFSTPGNPHTPKHHVPPSIYWTFTPSHILCISQLSTRAASCVISAR